MTIVAIYLIIISVLGFVGTPFLVNEPRTPLTPGGALLGMAHNLVVFAAAWSLL